MSLIVGITQSRGAKGVLLDPRSYQEMVDALGILKLTAAGERDIEAGRVTDHGSTIASVRERLNARHENRQT